jgi:predicted dehydrogenase
MDQRLRVAVVGLGVGKSHVEAYQQLPEHFEVVAVCDHNLGRANEVAAAHGALRIYAELDDLCRANDVDLIDLCTPPYLHFAQIQQALAAGKHVVCEKPLVGSLAHVDALIEAEARAGRRVMPIFQYRFGHGLQQLRHLMAAGLTGAAYLATVELAWRRRAEYYEVPWRGRMATELGGTLLSHASHAIDALTYVLGPARRIFAHTATRVNPVEVEDCAAVSMELADGALATLAVTLGSAVQITRHRFCFQGLTAESNTQPYTNTHAPWVFTGDTPAIAAQIEAELARFQPQPERFVGQFQRFARAMAQSEELPVTLADARTSLEHITAMYLSAQTKQPVTLPLDREHSAYNGWAAGREN